MKNETFDFREAPPRIDLRDKVTGTAQYVEDLPDLPNTAYGATLLSPYSHARIVSIDSSEAERSPGVLAVVDREHLDGQNPRLKVAPHEHFKLADDQDFIAIDKVRFDGELVAAVVAEDLRSAQRALEKIRVEYEPLPPVFSAAEALAPGAPLVHEEHGSNLLLEDSLVWGDIGEGFRQADRVFEETFTSPSMFHHPMEHVGGCLAHYINGELNIWLPTTAPVRDGGEFAHFLGVESDKVRLRVPYIGGGFGAKIPTPAHFAAVFLSRKTGRPVRLIPSEEHSFRQNSRHAEVFKAKVGVKTDGTLTALEVDLIVDTGAYITGGAVAAHNSVISAWGCYRIPNLRIKGRCAYTNKVPAGHTRATGKIQTTWGIECTMDSVARQMGIDPYQFRKKNVLLRGDFVAKGTPAMDTDFLDLMAEAVAGIGWDGKSNLKPTGKSEPGSSPWARGRGMALSLRHGSQGGGRAYALATMDARGVVTIQHNAPEAGQGTQNLFSVIAAQTLEIPQSQVRVKPPDTAVNLPFAGVSAQRTTMQMGNAVYDACVKLKQELFSLAAQAKGGKPEEWQLIQGRLCWGETSFSISEIIRALGGSAVLKCVGHNKVPITVKDSAFAGMDHWAPSGAAIDLEVNANTGELRILGYSVIADAGKALHYPSAKAQTDGGAVMGFGHALLEETIYQEGQLQNGDPFQYRLPVMKDIPEVFYSSMLEKGDGPGPFGSKGMSQTSIVTVAPAIGNAIYDALGVRVRSLPISPEKILRAMGKI
ncbi:MAG TPA: xanthine dehydrogenase family protein molybdopterin-binding subunit [Candidatus Acidoferrales bacterium]|nr:xanthine dehydrogenase family protein molybdopterin-binding subunit [Candidatus Acidoferrales bacterium]